MAIASSDIVPEALLARMERGDPPLVLDVRSLAEFSRSHIPGALHVPFWIVPWRVRSLPALREDPIVVYCGHGPRARIARTLLRLRGFTNVRCLARHMSRWRRAGLPATSSDALPLQG